MNPRLRRNLAWRHIGRLAPALLVLVLVVVVPLGRVVWTSLHRSSPVGNEMVGFDNYTHLFSNRSWWLAVATSLVIVAVVVVVQVVLGIVLGSAIHRVGVAWPVSRILVLLPFVSLSVVSVVTWRDAVSGGYLAEWFNIDDPGPATRLAAVTVGEMWRGTGLVAAVVALALAAVPASLANATIADGATGLQRWRHVVLPSIAPALAGVAVFRVLDTYRVLDGPLLADDPDLATAPFLTWTTQFTAFEWGLGAAMSVIVLLVAVVLAAIVGPLFRVRRLL